MAKPNIQTDADGFEGPDASPDAPLQAGPDPVVEVPAEDGGEVAPGPAVEPTPESEPTPEERQRDLREKRNRKNPKNADRSDIAARSREDRLKQMKDFNGDVESLRGIDQGTQDSSVAGPDASGDGDKEVSADVVVDGASPEAPRQPSPDAPHDMDAATVTLQDGSTVQVPLDRIRVPTRIDGQDGETTALDARKAYQLNGASEHRLEKAREIVSRAAQLSSSPDQPDQLNGGPPASAPDQPDAAPVDHATDPTITPDPSQSNGQYQPDQLETAKKIVESLQFGDVEEGARALLNFQQSQLGANGTSPSDDIRQVARQEINRSDRERRYQESLDAAIEEYPDVLRSEITRPAAIRQFQTFATQDLMENLGLDASDIQEALPAFGGSVSALHDHFLSNPEFAGVLTSERELFRKTGEHLRSEVRRLAGVNGQGTENNGGAPATPAQTRQERKAATVPQTPPGRGSGRVRSEPSQPEPLNMAETRSRAISQMQKRNQGHAPTRPSQ